MPSLSKPVFSPRLILLTAVAAVAVSGPLTRYVQLPVLTLVAWRLTLTLPFLWLQARLLGQYLPAGPVTRTTRRDWILSILLLGFHFLTFAAGVKMAGIALATMLLALQPLLTALLSPRLTGEPAPPGARLGLLLALPGTALVALSGGLGPAPAPWLGILIAIAAALSGSIYFLLTRRLRHALPFGLLIASNYSGAALLVMTAAAIGAGPGLAGLIVPRAEWFGLALLILIPTAIGHNLLNYSLRLLPAPTVNLAILLEPVIATLIAILFFAERPAPLFFAGAALVMTGCFFALRPRPLDDKTPAAEK